MEPRARMRTKGQVFQTNDLNELLYAFGDATRTPSGYPSLPTTVTCLDEILTDFVIETCHAAALSASYSRRQKIKVDDFKWVLRKDERLLGRALEHLWREKSMKDARKVPGLENLATAAKETAAAFEDLAEAGGVNADDMKEDKKKKKKRKRRRADQATGEERERKRAAS